MEIREWKLGDPRIPFGTTGIFRMASKAYHSDPCETPSLSSSIAKLIVGKSAMHGWLAHPRLGKARNESSKALDRGTLIHSMILGHDASDFAIIQADDFRTKSARMARDSARAEGLTPCRESDYRDAQAVAEEVHDDLQGQGIMLNGMSEVVLLWVEDVSGRKVQCRAMIDHLIPDLGRIIDLKTCDSAHPTSVQRAIYNFGYDVQHAAYVSAYEHVFPDMAGRSEFLWAFIELLPDESPRKSLTQLYKPEGAMRELGCCRWKKAVSLWSHCAATGRWQAYADGCLGVTPAGWVIREELGESP